MKTFRDSNFENSKSCKYQIPSVFLACHETRKSSEESSRSESKHAGGGKRERTTTVGTWLQVCLAASGGGPLLRTNGSVSSPLSVFRLSFPLHVPDLSRTSTTRGNASRIRRGRERERRSEESSCR